VSGAQFLVFTRCAGLVSRAPGFSHPSLPPAVRAGLAIVLALALAPAYSNVRVPEGAAFALAAALDFSVGAAIGFAASMLYDGAYAGGRALDDYVGIRGSVPGAAFFAASGFGRVWSMLFTAGFFLLGGYAIVIEALARSFERVPPGWAPSTASLYGLAIALPGAIVEAALLVAGPPIALAFTVQITLAALTRVIPRFASFTLSFPIVFAVAVAATLAMLPALVQISGTPWLRAPFPSR